MTATPSPKPNAPPSAATASASSTNPTTSSPSSPPSKTSSSPKWSPANPAPKAAARAKSLLATFGLAHRESHLPGKLSGGEKQRVAIARALANNPAIILADEPTGNLDVATSAQVFEALLQTVRAQGVAALIATHNPDLAARMDRRVTLQNGQIVEV